MKKIFLILTYLLLSISVQAQKNLKLVEQSTKEKPNWISNNGQGFYMIQANKMSTLEEAQNAVLSSLLSQIASSIAVTIQSETENNIDWTTVELDGKTRDEYVQVVKTNTSVKIAKMPALQGISLSKAEVYWEKYTDKKTKENFYDYYILYPFSQFDLQALIDSYNAMEKALEDKISNYKDSLNELNDIDLMLENINEMKTLMNEIGKEDPKYYKIKNIIHAYENLINNIYIDVLGNTNGNLTIQLKYDEKILKTKSLPQVKGECARDFNKKHNGNTIEITFNTFDCYEQDDNYVEVRFTFGKKRIIKKININI